MRRGPFVVCLVPLGILLACSSDISKPPPGADGTASSAGGISGGGGDAAAEGSSLVDGGDAGTCTTIPNTGALVARNGIIGDPPVQTGGTIAPGNYDLTTVSVYVGTTGVGGPSGQDWQESIAITATTLERVRLVKDNVTGASQETREAFGYLVNQASFAVAETCPFNTAAMSDSYTATDTQLTIVETLTKEVYVYQKR